MNALQPESGSGAQADDQQGEKQETGGGIAWQNVLGREGDRYRYCGQAAARQHEEVRLFPAIDIKHRGKPGGPDQCRQKLEAVSGENGMQHQPGQGHSAAGRQQANRPALRPPASGCGQTFPSREKKEVDHE